MRKHTQQMWWAAVIVLCCCIIQPGQALAETYYDNIVNFPWLSPVNSSWDNDTYNTDPDIIKVDVTWNEEGVLQKITLTADPGTKFLFPASLFINTNYQGTLDVTASENFAALQQWDWYVQKDDRGMLYPHTDANYVGGNDKLVDIAGNGLYQVTNPLDYTYSNERHWDGRDGHINGLAYSALGDRVAGSENMEGADSRYGNYWAGLGPNNTLVYDFTWFSDNPIYLGDQFVIAYSPYCANDVVLIAGTTTTAPNPSAVPEPATLSLCCMGLAGLAGWRWRHARKTQKKAR